MTPPAPNPGADVAGAEARAARAGDRDFRRRLLVVITIGVVALAALIATSILLFQRERDIAKLVNHAYGAETQISLLSADIERIETARRGYLLLPADNFWRTFVQTRAAIGPQLEQLARYVAANPRQVRHIANLRPLVAAKFAQYDDTIVTLHEKRLPSAFATFVRERDQHVTEKIRNVLLAMTAEEERVMTLRSASRDRVAAWLLSATVGAAALLIVLAIAVMVLVSRFADALQRSQADLLDLNLGLEDVVRERTAELTRANEEVQRFAYIVSHDLRSPLVNVLGFTGELESALPPLTALLRDAQARAPELVTPAARAAIEDDIPEAIGFIRSSTQKMDRLINAILKLSREGRRTPIPEALDMAALLQGVVSSMRRSIDAGGAEVIIEETLPSLIGDRVMLEQLFSNLLENAVKYLEPERPGRIIVRGRSAGSKCVYEVEDNGRGIEAKDHARVFELFRRAGRQDQPGEGIGLAHVQALAWRLGGHVEVESRFGEGSIFRVSLPRTMTEGAR